MDGSFIEIALTTAGLAAINASLGSKLIMGGLVPTLTGPLFQQQPFGSSGADKPVLTVVLVPETATVAMWRAC